MDANCNECQDFISTFGERLFQLSTTLKGQKVAQHFIFKVFKFYL